MHLIEEPSPSARAHHDQSSSCNILIVGAGLAGVATAIALTRASQAVVVLEAHEQFTELGAGIQIPPNATNIFRRWGLLETLRNLSTSPQNVVFRSYKDSSILSSINLNPHIETAYGAPHLLIHRARYLETLAQEAHRLGVVFRMGCLVSEISLREGSVKTIDGEVYRADLILAADGERSICRSALLDRLDLPELCGRLVYRFSVKLEDMLADPDLKELAQPLKITCWIGPQAHVVCYWVKNPGNICTISLTYPDREQRIQFGPRSATIGDMKQKFWNWNPTFRRLINLAQDASYWTLLQLKNENRYWSHPSGKLLLIGDAAHSMTPYLAQGASQCIEDAAILGELFSYIRTKEQIPGVLRVFQNIRIPRSLAIRQRAAKAGELMELPDGPQQEERDRRMMEEEPYEGYPNPFGDPTIQQWLYDYDCIEVASRAWKEDVAAQHPGALL